MCRGAEINGLLWQLPRVSVDDFGAAQSIDSGTSLSWLQLSPDSLKFLMASNSVKLAECGGDYLGEWPFMRAVCIAVKLA